jgi:hypothetical protein
MTAMMTIAPRIKWRQQVSCAPEQSSSVANVIANVTSVVVSAVVCRHTWQTRMQTNLGSLPGRTFQPWNRRSIEDIYKELGEGYLRRAYRMNYRTFKTLAAKLCPFVKDASGQKGTANYTPNGPLSSNVRLCLCDSMVCWRLSLQHYDYIWYWLYRHI